MFKCSNVICFVVRTSDKYICLSVCLSVCQSVCLPVCLSLYFLAVYLSVHLSDRLSVCLSVQFLPDCLSFCPFFGLFSINPSFHSVCLPFCLPISAFVSLSDCQPDHFSNWTCRKFMLYLSTEKRGDEKSQEIRTKYRETQMSKSKVQVTRFQIKAFFTIECSFPYDM